jgi:hypothetical protein
VDTDATEAAMADARFRDVITTESELRKHVGPANRWLTSKILHRLDRRCQSFIAASPFVVIGSTNQLDSTRIPRATGRCVSLPRALATTPSVGRPKTLKRLSSHDGSFR